MLSRVRIKGRETREDVMLSEVMCYCFTRHSKFLGRCICSGYGTLQMNCKENSALEKSMGGR